MSTPPLHLDRSRAPWWANRTTRCLAAAVIFAAGFFAGAILFGLALTASIPTTP